MAALEPLSDSFRTGFPGARTSSAPRRGLATDWPMSNPVSAESPSGNSFPTRDVEPRPADRWFTWWRSAFAVAVVLVLFALGVENMALRAEWHEVEDGVLWAPRSEGLTAIEFASGSSGEAAGI